MRDIEQYVCTRTASPRMREVYGRTMRLEFPVKGSIYTFRARCKVVGTNILLYEIRNPHVTFRGAAIRCEASFPDFWFRPVKKTDISAFTGLLQGKPVKEDA